METLVRQLLERAEAEGGEEWLRSCLALPAGHLWSLRRADSTVEEWKTWSVSAAALCIATLGPWKESFRQKK